MRNVESLFHLPSYISLLLVPAASIDRNQPLARILGRMQATAFSQFLEFANRYVLDDQVVVYGPDADRGSEAFSEEISHEVGELLKFLNEEVTRAGSITEIPPRNLRFPRSLFENGATSLPSSEDPFVRLVYEELGRCREPDINDIAQFPSRREVRATHLMMLLSDYKSYDFVLQSMSAPHALRTYPLFLAKFNKTVAKRQPFHPEFHDFQIKFEETMRSPVSYGEMQFLKSPSFLLEALRQVERPEGVFHVLREFRYSPAAIRYRDVNRARHYGSSAKEREMARAELQANVKEIFSAEGMKSRVPQWVINSVSLSAAAFALIFPGVASAAALAIPALLTGDYAHKYWFGCRRNVFTDFSAEEGDLFAELDRVWGPLLCTREQLANTLAKCTQVTKELEVH